MDYRRDESERRQDPAANEPDIARPRRSVAHWATIGMFTILAIAALSLARPILLPVVAAFVITMMLSPLSALAQRHHVPAALQAVVLWLLVSAVFYGVIAMLSAPAVEWLGKAPQIGQSIQQKLQLLEKPLAILRDVRNALLPSNGNHDVGFDIVGIVQPAVSLLTPALAQIVIFFAALFFMLLGRVRLRHDLIGFFDARQQRLRALRIMHEIEHNISGYLGMVAMINIVIGVGAGLIAWVVGLPEPTAWAVLGFVLNFVPIIGAMIVEVSMFLVGLVTFATVPHALIAPLLYIAMATLEGQIVTPSLVGRRLTLNPLIVFLSLVFWSWLWGPVGAFLAAPLLIIGLVATSHLSDRDEPVLPD